MRYMEDDYIDFFKLTAFSFYPNALSLVMGKWTYEKWPVKFFDDQWSVDKFWMPCKIHLVIE